MPKKHIKQTTLLDAPVFYVHSKTSRDVDGYYDSFQEIRIGQVNEWGGWKAMDQSGKSGPFWTKKLRHSQLYWANVKETVVERTYSPIRECIESTQPHQIQPISDRSAVRIRGGKWSIMFMFGRLYYSKLLSYSFNNFSWKFFVNWT